MFQTGKMSHPGSFLPPQVFTLQSDDKLGRYSVAKLAEMKWNGELTVELAGSAGKIAEERSCRLLQDRLELLVADIVEFGLHGRRAARHPAATHAQLLAC